MFEDDGVKFVREVEPDPKVRGKYERKKRTRVGPRSIAGSSHIPQGRRHLPQ